MPTTEIDVKIIRKSQSIATCVTSARKPKSALNVIIIKEVATACLISRAAKSTNAGTMTNPPPAPTKPVRSPTPSPMAINEL